MVNIYPHHLYTKSWILDPSQALSSKVGAINQMESSIIVSSRAILPFKGFLLDTKNKCKEGHLLQLQKQPMQLQKESLKNSGLPGFKH